MSSGDAGQQREDAVPHAVVVQAEPDAGRGGRPPAPARSAAEEVSSVSSVKDSASREGARPDVRERGRDLGGQALGGDLPGGQADGHVDAVVVQARDLGAGLAEQPAVEFVEVASLLDRVDVAVGLPPAWCRSAAEVASACRSGLR